MKTEVRPIIRIIIAFCLLVSTSIFADGGKTMLVLDASGSMWAKIEDGYKIKIAQRVVNDLLESIPLDQELGLVAYGHRSKGDCSDIETLVAPGTDTRSAISAAVNALNPRGKSPLSAAVVQAADVMRIEQNVATVILISDGKETCSHDPCTVGTELQHRGINFTTHVIGFDVADIQERVQLQCLAENTGGKFVTANNATELAQALVEVSPEVFAPQAERVNPTVKADRNFTATLNAPDQATLGQTISVQWEGPGEKNDIITISKPGSTKILGANRPDFGNPLKLQMPDEPGDYEIRYFLYREREVLTRRPITVK